MKEYVKQNWNFLNRYKWFRKWIGGTWYLIKPDYPFIYVKPFWSTIERRYLKIKQNGQTIVLGKVLEIEEYDIDKMDLEQLIKYYAD